jgi:hypothetical protein
MPRSPARKQPVPRNRTPGFEVGMGPKVNDAVSGIPIPKKLAVKQRGGWVDRKWAQGSRDKPDSY